MVNLFKGNYNYFDYKYNITGYNGQDFGGIAQKIYLLFSIFLIIGLLFYFRKYSKEKIFHIIRFLSIFLIIFYLSKTIWESIYDIKYNGNFNIYLLPFDSCSIIMYAGILASFFQGKIKEYSICWIMTGSIVGGIASMLYLNAFKYYPFFSFGALYSMLWHFIMVFMGLLLIVTNYTKINYKVAIKGFILHFFFSLLVIPIDYLGNLDFMMYKDLGGIPFFEEIASNLTKAHLSFINPIMMLALYFLSFSLVIILAMGIKKILTKIKGEKNESN